MTQKSNYNYDLAIMKKKIEVKNLWANFTLKYKAYKGLVSQVRQKKSTTIAVA